MLNWRQCAFHKNKSEFLTCIVFYGDICMDLCEVQYIIGWLPKADNGRWEIINFYDKYLQLDGF
jgi:hypothetical protein